MARSEFRTTVKALITFNGQVLIGQKEEGDQPHSGKWHIPGGHVEKEQPEKAIKREIEEETGLEVEVHHIIDVMSYSWNKDGELDSIQILYHCEASNKNAEARDDLKSVKWVEPENLQEQLWDIEAERLQERETRKNFLKKLKKMPSI